MWSIAHPLGRCLALADVHRNLVLLYSLLQITCDVMDQVKRVSKLAASLGESVVGYKLYAIILHFHVHFCAPECPLPTCACQKAAIH